MKHYRVIGILLAALTIAGSAQLSAQNSAPGDWQKVLSSDGVTVYDSVNHVVWLADANLPAKILPDKKPPHNNFRFGLPLCDVSNPLPTDLCVNASGSMNYTSAQKWIEGMNDANYLGHSDWQLPTTPYTDPSCKDRAKPGNNFGFGCVANALGYLYHIALGFDAPNTAVPIPPNTVGPFSNFQPNLYWSKSPGGGPTGSLSVFSFFSGAMGGSIRGDFLDVLPMIIGDPFGMPTSPIDELYVNSDGTAVYDPATNVTWLADANLAATWLPDSNLGEFDTLGLPLCETAPDKTPCVAQDGSMDYASAQQFINNMNAYDNGPDNPPGYLGQATWQLPLNPANCSLYNCLGTSNPMGELFYIQLGKSAGEPVVEPPDITVGPFHDLQPFPYWSCQADAIQDACEAGGPNPPKNPPAEWGFSFGDGFLGTARLPADHFVTAYYVVTIPPTKPPIPPKCPPTDPSCYQ
jgi:hypothetical protein